MWELVNNLEDDFSMHWKAFRERNELKLNVKYSWMEKFLSIELYVACGVECEKKIDNFKVYDGFISFYGSAMNSYRADILITYKFSYDAITAQTQLSFKML